MDNKPAWYRVTERLELIADTENEVDEAKRHLNGEELVILTPEIMAHLKNGGLLHVAVQGEYALFIKLGTNDPQP